MVLEFAASFVISQTALAEPKAPEPVIPLTPTCKSMKNLGLM